MQALTTAGHDVIVLARDPEKAATLNPPFRLITGLSQLPDSTRIDAIVNLAGEPIANGLWTTAKRHKILASRLRMTGNVVRLIRRLEHKPAVLINGSAVGWYGVNGDETLTEAAEGRPCFSRSVCADWGARPCRPSASARAWCGCASGSCSAPTAACWRTCSRRSNTGLAAPSVRARSGYRGSSATTSIRLIAHAIATPDLKGAVNATAPEPVRNAAFMRELGAALHRPVLLRLPAAPLRLALGDLAEELLIGGQRVVPEKALRSGFTFCHITLRSALAAMLGTRAGGRAEGRFALPHGPAALSKK